MAIDKKIQGDNVAQIQEEEEITVDAPGES